MRRLALLLLLATGCSASHSTLINSTPIPDRISRIVWTHDFTDRDIDLWEQRLVERWPDRKLAIVYCHGGFEEYAPGTWNLYPDGGRQMSAESAAQIIHALLPGRLVVILACNPNHDRLHEPDTAYALDYVWLKPGLIHRFSLETFEYRGAVGTAWGLQVNR